MLRLLVQLLLSSLMVAAGWRVGQQFHAARIAREQPTPEGLAAALRWDPEEAGYHYRLGVIYRDASELRDRAKSREHLEAAVELNPYNWRYRRELADLYEQSGLMAQAEAAFARAVEMNPRSGSYRWRLANFHLRNGSLDKALPRVKEALVADPQLLPAAAGLLLKAGAGREQIESVWPDEPAAWRELLMVASRQATGRAPISEMGRVAWRRLMSLPEPLPLATGQVYIERLVADGRFQDARRSWSQLADSNAIGDAEFAAARSWVWNGTFERPLAGLGLGWRTRSGEGLVVHRVAEEGHGGSAALKLELDGTRNVSYLGVTQHVIVEPATVYRLTCRLRSEGLSTDRGVFWEVVDPGDNRILLATEPILGSTPWGVYAGSFRVSSDSSRVLLRLSRRPSLRFENRLSGTLWIDFVRLEVVAS